MLNKSPALGVYSVCVCSVHWSLRSLPKSHFLAFSYPVCTFSASGKRGPSYMHIFPVLLFFCIDRLGTYFYLSLFICMSLCKYLFF